jgi:hypothetical protein
MTTKTAKTRKGKLVEVGKLHRVAGGYAGYVMGRQGYAIAVFVPAKGE